MSLNIKRVLSFLLVFALVLGLTFTPLANVSHAEESDKVTITVLGTTDIHGNIYNWSYEDSAEADSVGLSKVYTIIQQIREENPNTLLIDNGDNLQGTILTDDVANSDLSKPNPMIDVMNFMGYDSMTLGNHEFNFGLELIHKVVDEAEFPILSANIYNEDGTNFVTPYTVKEIGGVKVGIIGLTTPNIPRWDGPNVVGLEFKNMADEAEKYVKILKEEEKVDIVIATTHAGLEGEYDPNKGDSAEEVIKRVPEIDALLTGHDHSDVSEVIEGTLVGGAKNAGAKVVRFDIKLQKTDDTWTVIDSESSVQLIETAGVPASEELKEYAKEYHEATLNFITDEIGTVSETFQPENEVPGIPEGQIRDTAVIDLINEVQLKYTGADVAAAALFKSTSDLKAGPVTYANIFDIYKYPNTLYAVEVTGAELKNYMEWSAAYYNTYTPGDLTISFNPDIRAYNYDSFSGVDYKIDISKPAGERIVDLEFNGEPVKDDQILKLAINNYRYGGLTDMGIISNEAYFTSDPVSLRTYISQFIQEQGTISPKVDNNWEVIGYSFDDELREQVIDMVKSGEITIPTSEDGRTPNAKSLNVYTLIDEGVLQVNDNEVPEAPEEPEVPEITPNTETYIVKSGDVLWRIAKQFGLTWENLAKLNNLKNPHLILPGQEIIIPVQ